MKMSEIDDEFMMAMKEALEKNDIELARQLTIYPLMAQITQEATQLSDSFLSPIM